MSVSYKKFLDEVTEKLSWVTDEIDFLYPYSTKEGKYENAKNHPFSWTSGFYGGILWSMYQLTKDEKYLKLAKESASRFEKCLTDFVDMDHDTGFQFLFTNVADYKLTGDEASKTRALHAATILAGRFNPTGRFIRAWNDNPYIDGGSKKTGYVIIDCMMNIPLLYWASEVTEDPRFKQIANLHAETVIKHFVREDGSVNHIVVFDAETGEVTDKPAGQGYASGSSWTRGQAWAIYGFAMAYYYTRNERYLETAKKVAKYFMENVRNEYVPIDFCQPEDSTLEDNSAAAICVCGLLEVLKHVPDKEKAFYQKSAETLMNIIYNNCDFSHDEESVLQNCSVMWREGHHISLIYADYYMLEALMRLNGYEVL